MGYRYNDRCLAKVDANEPIFVLRAQDALAIETIQYWLFEANFQSFDGVRLKGAISTLSGEHYDEVRALVERMREWQAANRDRLKRPD